MEEQVLEAVRPLFAESGAELHVDTSAARLLPPEGTTG